MNSHDKQQSDHSREFYREILEKGDFDAFTNQENIWHWMHANCMKPLDEFFRNIPRSRFVTIGDGYCGREAAIIKRYGHWACATDQEIALLHVANNRELISNYMQQNMNQLEIPDDVYDYAFVKESLHHSRTPYVALAEMMRVSKKGVILIEPNGDQRKEHSSNGFEGSGNYMFSFRSDELVQIGLAAGYKYFAYCYTMIYYGMHDFDAIQRGEIEQEKRRLSRIEYCMEISSKPLLCFLFLKDKEDMVRIGNNFRLLSLTNK